MVYKLFLMVLFNQNQNHPLLIYKTMHHLYRKQEITASIDKTWEFFTDPANLKRITPDFMGFDIQSFSGQRDIHAGQIITYKVRPILNIPLQWVTEITHVRQPYFFVDEQRWGPFLFWHHKHYQQPTTDGNVELIDSVHYKVFYGFAGNLINQWVVRKRLEHIFDYRTKVIGEIFGVPEKESI